MTSKYKSSAYKWYEDNSIANSYSKRKEHIPSTTWYGTTFPLLLEYMTKIRPVDVKNYDYIDKAFKFQTTVKSNKEIYFNTLVKTVNVRVPVEPWNSTSQGMMNGNIAFKHYIYRLFWGWGSFRQSATNEGQVCDKEKITQVDKFIHMNPDWGASDSDYGKITLQKGGEYVLILHLDSPDASGDGKPQFWAVLKSEDELADFNVPLQKYKGQSDCVKQSTSAPSWAASQDTYFDHLHGSFHQYPNECGVPPENERECY